MSTRISRARGLPGGAILLLGLHLGLLGGCDRAADTPANATARAEAAAAEDEGRILCAHGTGPLQRDCTVEQTQSPDGLLLTLRHPDGGFRRLRVTRDGRGVVAADGADPARVTVVGPADIDVTVGTDHYRLPATIRPGARPT